MRAVPFLGILLLACAPVCRLSPAGPPNIVVILADDLGYGDVRALNPKSRIPTPNLDRLAARGMTFTDAHSPSAVCTPTRYGLLTGRYCWRTWLKRGVLNGYSKPLIQADRLTIAGLLSRQGYHTSVVGKWHLGLGFDGEGKTFDYTKPVTGGPTERGFDASHVIPASLDFPPYVYVRNGKVTGVPDRQQPAQKFPAFLRAGPIGSDFSMEDCLDTLTGHATAVIRKRAAEGSPFFLYFPMTAPHKPVLPHRRFRGKTDLGPYGDFVVQVDWTVGQVLKAIDEAGIAGNTLVVFTSDNGSYMFRRGRDEPGHVDDPSIQAFREDRHTSNHVFRGTKADVWEGGHRVPFLVRWPGVVVPGSTCDATVCHVDVMATCAEAAGAALPDDAAEDSFSLVPLLKGGTWKRGPVINHSGAGMFAIRDGKWKLVAGNGSGGREKPKGSPFEKPYRLFDLSKDVSERRDLAAEQTEVVSRLTAALEKIRTSGRSRQ